MGARRMAALVGHQIAAKGHHDNAILIKAFRIEIDDSGIRAACAFSLSGHFAAGIDRITDKNRMGQFDLVPAKIGHRASHWRL